MKSTTVARLVLIAEVFKGANRCRTRRTDPCEIRAKLLGQSAVAVDHLRRPVDGNLCAARGIAGEVDQLSIGRAGSPAERASGPRSPEGSLAPRRAFRAHRGHGRNSRQRSHGRPEIDRLLVVVLSSFDRQRGVFGCFFRGTQQEVQVSRFWRRIRLLVEQGMGKPAIAELSDADKCSLLRQSFTSRPRARARSPRLPCSNLCETEIR